MTEIHPPTGSREAGAVSDSETGIDTDGWKTSTFMWNLLRSVFLYLSYISLGLNVSIAGSTFLDLLLIVNTDVEKGSVIYTAGSVGYAFGALVAGVLYDRYNRDILLFLAVFFLGSFSIAMIWCPLLWLMSVASALRGAAMGSLDTGGNTVCVGIWKDEGSPYLQALHFSFSIGGTIAPFIAEPFLAPKGSRTSANNTLCALFNGRVATNGGDEKFAKITELNGTNCSDLHQKENIHETEVEFAYLIIGAITVATSLPFLYAFDQNRANAKKRTPKVEADEITATQTADDNNAKADDMSWSVRIMFLLPIGLFYMLYVSVESSIEGYLMTYVVKYLDWSKTDGTRITSIFWAAFAVGRFLGIFTAKLLTPWKMLLLDFILLNVIFVPLLFVNKELDLIVWICIPISGAFMATIFPTGISWIDQKIMKLNGKVAAFLILSSTLGGVLNPMLLGYLFENVTPMWLIYLLMIESGLCLLQFLILSCMVWKTGNDSYRFTDVSKI